MSFDSVVEVINDDGDIVIVNAPDEAIVVLHPDDVASIYVGDQGPPGPAGTPG